jgi:hypothetical protein
VEINRLRGADGFELKIKCVLNLQYREAINEFLEKRKLRMREEKGTIMISE